MRAEGATVLVVDDDPALGHVLLALLRQDGFQAEHVLSADSALATLQARPFDLVITDLRMPGTDGMELLRHLTSHWPQLPVIMLTAHGTVTVAVEAMKSGAADFILKPFDREEVRFAVEKALVASRPQREQAPPIEGQRKLVGESAVTKGVHRLITKAAGTDATVLILGESGTGKELVVEEIHAQSHRAEKALVKVHCAALPETLLEAELFGYEKGAFTGAVHRKPGRVELAAGGTLFLDEIGDVSPAIQVKLLRLLQEKQFERLGSTQTRQVDVRFVAATHRDLEAMIARGEFREDLFYRLNVIPIAVPPLRDRVGDVALLARHFSAQLSRAEKKDVVLEKQAIELLERERWPGNVRQLHNVIERLIVFADGATITADDVASVLTRRSTSAGIVSSQQRSVLIEDVENLDEARRQAELEVLTRVLERCAGNRTQAARVLGVSRRTLYNKLTEHGLL